jgi:carboxylate-amine ligase
VPDAQSSLEDAGALIALIHCLAIHEAAAGPSDGPSGGEVDDCCFRAMRDGRGSGVPLRGQEAAARPDPPRRR